MTQSALCIGIHDYPGTDRDLAGCVNDAADWAAALGKRGFEVATLLDRQAIGTGIRKAIRDLLARSRAGDVALVPWFSSRATARSCQTRTRRAGRHRRVPLSPRRQAAGADHGRRAV